MIKSRIVFLTENKWRISKLIYILGNSMDVYKSRETKCEETEISWKMKNVVIAISGETHWNRIYIHSSRGGVTISQRTDPDNKWPLKHRPLQLVKDVNTTFDCSIEEEPKFIRHTIPKEK